MLKRRRSPYLPRGYLAADIVADNGVIHVIDSASAIGFFVHRSCCFGLFAQVGGAHFFAVPPLATPAEAFVVDDAHVATAAAWVFVHLVLLVVQCMLINLADI